MAKRKVIRKSNRLFTYSPNQYSWGGDFINSLNLKEALNGSAIGEALKGGLGSIGGAVGNIAGGAIGGNLQSGAGSAISNIGGAIGSGLSMVNPVLGGIVSAASGVLGGLTNRVFGSNINQEAVSNIQGSNVGLNNLLVDSSSVDSVMNQWATQDFGKNFSQSDIGEDGWFSNKAEKKYAELKRQQDAARARALSALGNAANAADLQSDFNALANYQAHGGKIYIKPENRGKFTKYCGGKVTSECIAKGKRSSDPAIRKRATFAANARKWHHAFGGILSTNGADWDNGVTIIGNGDTHENNPYEGVQMGIDPNGIPNLVEEGEVIFNNYVFSNRLTIPDTVREKYKLRGNKELTFAEAAKQMQRESEERPNDPISKRGLRDSMLKLQQEQESLREEKQLKNSRKYAEGGPVFPIAYEDFYVLPEEYPYGIPGFLKDTKLNTPTFKVNPDLSGKVEGINIPLNLPTTTMNGLPTKVDTNLPDVIDNPLKFTEGDLIDESNRGVDWLRYAPVVGSAIGIGQNLLSNPDYSSSDAIMNAANEVGEYTPVGYTPIGNYLQYNPFDRNFYTNKLAAQAGATRRAIMNTSNPSRNAALLAADYNAQGKLGDLARQAEEYNLAQRQAVETFNRGTNMANAEMGLKAAMANQEAALKARSSRLSGVAQAMAVRDAVDARRDASMSANLTNFFNSLGDIGREEYSRNMIMSNPALYYSIDSRGNITYKNGYESLSEAEKKEVRDAASKAKNKKAKGGYLTIKKK